MSVPEPVPPATIEQLQRWMDREEIGSGPITDARQLTGGTQNILLRFTRDRRDLVLRRPPLHKRANSDETMRREAVILGALAETEVPHPRLVGSCHDQEVMGCSFLVMEAVPGFAPTAEMPERYRTDEKYHYRVGIEMTNALVAVGQIDYTNSPIANLGRAEGWLERQVPRWQKQLDSYAALNGWTGTTIPGLESLGPWLEQNRPSSWLPGIIHGDFHFANVLLDRNSPQVSAVVDWELCTVGDPLLDVGHLLATWPDPTDPRKITLATPLSGLPSRTELIENYAAGSARDLSNIDWYEVLAAYRLAIILEGTYARSLSGHAPRDTGEELHAAAASLTENALALI